MSENVENNFFFHSVIKNMAGPVENWFEKCVTAHLQMAAWKQALTI